MEDVRSPWATELPAALAAPPPVALASVLPGVRIAGYAAGRLLLS